MILRLLSAGIFALLLVSCGNSVVEVNEVNRGSGSLIEETWETEKIREENALALSYENALEIRDTVRDLRPHMDEELRTEIETVFIAFNEHIEALLYFVDESETRPLTDEETVHLVEILSDIETMISMFAEVMDLLSLP